MNRIWIFALASLGIIGGACSDDVPNAPEENKESDAIEIIELSSSGISSSSFSLKREGFVMGCVAQENKIQPIAKQINMYNLDFIVV